MSVKKNFKNSAVKPSEPGLLSFFILLNNNRLDDNASGKLIGPSRLSLSLVIRLEYLYYQYYNV